MTTPYPDFSDIPKDMELVLRVMPMPADCNGNGDIFGGWVMSRVDQAGAVLPARLVRGRMVTVAVREFVFRQPVRVGDLVSLYAKIIRVGNTSVTVEVEAYTESMRDQGRFLKVTQAVLTYVLVDDSGRPLQIPQSCRDGFAPGQVA